MNVSNITMENVEEAYRAIVKYDKLHLLLGAALKDFKACEKDRNYTIDMLCWHAPSKPQHVCRVCLAGSILAKTCKLGIGVEVDAT